MRSLNLYVLLCSWAFVSGRLMSITTSSLTIAITSIATVNIPGPTISSIESFAHVDIVVDTSSPPAGIPSSIADLPGISIGPSGIVAATAASIFGAGEVGSSATSQEPGSTGINSRAITHRHGTITDLSGISIGPSGIVAATLASSFGVGSFVPSQEPGSTGINSEATTHSSVTDTATATTSGSAAASTSTSSLPASSESNALSTGAKAGLGVGIGLGVPILALLLYLAVRPALASRRAARGGAAEEPISVAERGAAGKKTRNTSGRKSKSIAQLDGNPISELDARSGLPQELEGSKVNVNSMRIGFKDAHELE